MIAQAKKTELSASQQDMLAQIWQREEALQTASSDLTNCALATDFVSFDARGSTLARAEYCADLVTTKKQNIVRLWGYFGSNDSCCLAYNRTDNHGNENVCLVLWIERDGEWRKAFHQENQKFS